MTATCRICGQEWPRDPALEVPCPTCKAPIGTRCRRPSGHHANGIHEARDRVAVQTIPGYGQCPAAQPAAPRPTRRSPRSAPPPTQASGPSRPTTSTGQQFALF